MRVWLDDLREAPDGWLWLTSSRAAIDWLEWARMANVHPQVWSFDHDLGGSDTSRPVVLWMCQNEFWPDECYDSAIRSRRDIEVSHGKVVCKCGKVVRQCRCMESHGNITYTDRCEHEWWTDIENELDSQYDVAAYWDKKGRYLEVDLPASRQRLEVSLTNVYGFVISLVMTDETGGILNEVDLYSCVKREDIADTIHSVYSSY